MKLKDLNKEEQERVLSGCEKVKRNEITEEQFLDVLFKLYGEDFYLPEHYYTKPEFEVKEIKEKIASAESIKDKYKNKGKQKEQPKEQPQPKPQPKTKQETLNELDSLLDSMLED